MSDQAPPIVEVPLESAASPDRDSEGFADDRPSLRDELRAAQAGQSTRPRQMSDVEAERRGLGSGEVAAEPSPEQVDAEDRELIRSLGVNEAELDAFVKANPDVERLIPEAKTKEDVARNVAALSELMVGRNARQVVEATDRQGAAENAMAMVLDGDPDQAHAAMNELIAKTGYDAPEAHEVFDLWAEVDPQGAEEWGRSAIAQAHHTIGEKATDAYHRNVAAIEGDAQATLAAATAAVQKFTASHPDAERYAGQMIQMASESGIDLLADRDHIGTTLAALYETAFNLDPHAQPQHLRDGSWRTSATWEQREQARMLQGSIPGNNRALPEYEKRLAERGFYLDGGEVRPLRPPTVDEATLGRHVISETKEEWAAAESARMAEAWDRPSIQEKLPGGQRQRDAKGRLAARGSAPAEPAKPEGDAYWDYVAGYS